MKKLGGRSGSRRGERPAAAQPLVPLGSLRCPNCKGTKSAQLDFYDRGDGRAMSVCKKCYRAKEAYRKKHRPTLETRLRLAAGVACVWLD
jgi:hypothetical protein